MFLVVFAIFQLTLSSRGIDAHTIVLDNLTSVTNCTKHLRNDLDIYSIYGNAGPDFNAAIKEDWEPFITIQILRGGTREFIDICVVNIGASGMLCTPFTTLSCYCERMEKPSNIAYFIATIAAVLPHSAGIVRAVWSNHNGTVVYSRNNLTVPLIYDSHDAVLTLKVNGHDVVAGSNNCGIGLIQRSENTLQLCCSNTALPCYPRLAFNGSVVDGNSSMCIAYQFTPDVDNYTVNVTISFAICNLKDYITASSCIMDSRVITTTTEATTYTESLHSTFTTSVTTTATTTRGTKFTTIFNFVTQVAQRSIFDIMSNTYEEKFAAYMLLNFVAVLIYGVLRFTNKQSAIAAKSRTPIVVDDVDDTVDSRRTFSYHSTMV